MNPLDSNSSTNQPAFRIRNFGFPNTTKSLDKVFIHSEDVANHLKAHTNTCVVFWSPCSDPERKKLVNVLHYCSKSAPPASDMCYLYLNKSHQINPELVADTLSKLEAEGLKCSCLVRDLVLNAIANTPNPSRSSISRS
jgi:hypothetical protein